MTSFSCYIVGDDSLAGRCGDVLLSKGWVLLGVSSSNVKVREWAADNNIPFLGSLTDLETFIKKGADFKPDYIFSISNTRIMKPSLLSVVRHHCVNYHNALLPKYGGVHATSWAILNNEEQHGITWHVMSGDIDVGPILEQRIIPIDREDTAAALNLKCHEAAFAIFPHLVDDLSSRLASLKPQEGEASYKSLCDKPANYGFISWKSSAQDIYTLFRGLCLSPFVNRITTPKFLINGDAYVPVQLKVTTTRTAEASPGEVLAVTSNALKIATGTNDIEILGVSSLGGRVFTIPAFVDLTDIREGDLLPDQSSVLCSKLSTLSGSNWRNETYWRNRFSSVYPFSLPYLEFDNGHRSSVHEVEFKLNTQLLDEVATAHSLKQQDIMFAVLLGYFYHLNNYSEYTVGLTMSVLQVELDDVEDYFAKVVPFNFSFNEASSFGSLLDHMRERLGVVQRRFTYESDIFIRYPDLREDVARLPVIINFGDRRGLFNTSALMISMTRNKLIFSARGVKNAECFMHAAEKMHRHLISMLKYISQHSEEPVYQIKIMPPDEKEQLSRVCNTCFVNDSSDLLLEAKTLPAWFSEKVSGGFKLDGHDYMASLVSGDETISFRELEIKSNRMANYLLSITSDCSAATKPVVVVYLEASMMLILSMLAIMKAGCIYVPLDPKLPKEQALAILDNIGCDVLITRSYLATKFSSFGGQLLRIDQQLPVIYKESSTLLSPIINFNDVAYIINTSGSTTGRSKSVPVRYEQIFNSLKTRFDYYNNIVDVSPRKMNMLLLLSTSFDTSVGVIFWSLLEGGKLFLLKPAQYGDAESIVDIITQQKITHLVCVPALYERILKNASKKGLESLRLVVLGGDHLSEEVLDNHVKLAGGATITYEFGLTEVTIWSTGKVVYDARNRERHTTTVGHPVGGNSIFVVDKYDQQMPFDVTGKILLGGDQLTHGYVNEPELNKLKYRKVRIGGQEVSVFDTGDLGSLSLAHGLTCKGREDYQFKINGVLISPNQIEKWLREYPNIDDCVVLRKRDDASNDYVVAYIVMNDKGLLLDYAEVKQYLARYLPVIAIPQVFMVLDQLPLTVHNKIDRKALPMPKMKQRISSSVYVAPANRQERILVNILSTLLHVDTVGVDDSIVELGAESIHVAELIQRVKGFFNAKIDIFSFYLRPTVRSLCSMIEGASVNDSVTRDLIMKDVMSDLDIDLRNCVDMHAQAQNILLTGATGFLGIHLLKDLLRQTNATIYCIVRADNENAANSKLINSAINNKLDTLLPDISKRVVIVLGNLKQPRLGLPTKIYMELAEKIGVIYHNAAEVHHLLDYSKLREVNVLSVVDLIKFAACIRPKRMHYVSTLSAVPDFSVDREITENFLISDSDFMYLHNGYMQTKWVAERLLTRAKQAGLSVNIYRPSWILGDSKTGVSPLDQNHLLLLIKGCLQMGYAPQWESSDLNIMPVDYVSRLIVLASLDAANMGRVFNVSNKHSISWMELISWINRCQHGDIKFVDPIEWRDSYLSKVPTDNSLYSLSPFYSREQADGSVQQLPAVKGNIVVNNMQSVLEAAGISYPKLSDKLLSIYFHFLYTEGFINDPPDLHALDYSVASLLTNFSPLFVSADVSEEGRNEPDNPTMQLF